MSENPMPPNLALMQMAGAFRLSQILYVTARLGLADLLKEGPKQAEELAVACGTSPTALYRLLRAVVSMGFFGQDDQGRFTVTSSGAYLQADHPVSVRPYILFIAGQTNWQAWGNFRHSINTGEAAFEHIFGMNLFEYATQNPEFGEIFNKGMAGITASMSRDLIATYDFSQFKRVVDVGGGNGSLLAALLTANPNLQGVIFDLPPVAERASKLITEAGLAGRGEVVGGDFFKAVPTGGDAYILKLILHDWDDEKAIHILKSCYQAMDAEAKLLVVDVVLPEQVVANNVHLTKIMFDMQMLTVTGGRERTETEFRQLFEAAGFRLDKVIPLPTRWSIVQGVKGS
jgi:predicted O-methyltransferase YrrM